MEGKAFGKIIRNARKGKKMNLRQCAALILNEDGKPIAFQYLNDIENNRRNPPSIPIIKQMSEVLEIPIELLYFYAEIFPQNINKNLDDSKLIEAYKEFTKALS